MFSWLQNYHNKFANQSGIENNYSAILFSFKNTYKCITANYFIIASNSFPYKCFVTLKVSALLCNVHQERIMCTISNNNFFDEGAAHLLSLQ